MSYSHFDVSKRLHSTDSIFNFQFSIFNCVCVLLFTVMLMSCNKDDNTDELILENWKQQNEKAFNDLANNPDYTEQKMPGGIASFYYRVIEKGNGKHVFYNSRAEVYYKGWFVVTNRDYNITAGTVFDHRLFDDGVTYKVAISSQVANTTYPSDILEGWKYVLQFMVEGDKWEIHIPSILGYGEKGKFNIPGYTTLAFEIELIKAIDPNEF